MYLRSACCDAPVRLDYDPTRDEFPVRCRRCGAALGVPEPADLPAQLRADLRWWHSMAAFHIRYMFNHLAAIPSGFVRITGC
jgi:hypothetical protein